MATEIQLYGGYRFIRYPDSPNRSDQVYFRGHVKVAGKWKKCYLHRYKWECECGPIPEGHHVHHKDNNPANNELSNLECKPLADHISGHWHSTPNKHEDSLLALQSAKEKAKLWHSSREGKEWHSQNAIKNGIGTHDRISMSCEVCGRAFEGVYQSRFCSNACRAKYRRINKLDHVECTCKKCGKLFMATRFKIPDCCSRSCGASYRHLK